MRAPDVLLAGFLLLPGSAVLGQINVPPAPVVISNVNYVNWTSATIGSAGIARGSIVISNLTVDITYTGEIASPTQTSDDGAINYWLPSTAYLSNVISNTPPNRDIMALAGGDSSALNTLSFSEPIQDPVLLILGLGESGVAATYLFDTPFELLSQGPGYWGDGFLTGDGSVLTGLEGHGAIQFKGLFSSISWTAPISNFWNGFTLGAPVSAPAPAIPEGRTWLASGLLMALAGFGWHRRRIARARQHFAGNSGADQKS